MTNVVGGDDDDGDVTDGLLDNSWPDYIIKAAGMFLNPDYGEEYICLQCSLMGYNFEEVKACARDLGYI